MSQQQEDQSRPHMPAQSLQSLTTSLSNLSSSSRTIPNDRDFHFYCNFSEFNDPIRGIVAQSQSALESIGSSHIWNRPILFPSQTDIDDSYDWLGSVNDEALESVDMSLDDFNKSRGKEKVDGKNENGFQLVCSKKKKAESLGGAESSSQRMITKNAAGDSVIVKVKEKKARVPFHIPTIRKPQEEYNILVNNSNQPFQHVWLQRNEDGERLIHPLEKLSVLEFVDKDIGDVEPVKPPPIEETPFKMVEEVKDLKELAAKLQSVNEFAVDLEHNQYRSFQGLTCLMQISTRTEDFVVDTLKLRIHVGPYLREVFKDPTKKKVMHGADRDVVWLQRDFGIYICNMFDTGQASRVLKLERNSLEHLLQHFCGVAANKEYQNADWRLRPLPDEMVRYGREDTHYLLYIYDMMKIRLFSMPKESESSDAPLIEVYKRSYDVCMQLYEKELLTENSYLYIYGLQGAGLNAHQLAIVAGLCEWRDVVARAEDESTGYILPNKTLLEIAKQMPLTPSKLRRLLKSKHPYIERNLGSVVSIIRDSMQNAAAFEATAQHLKEGRMEIAPQENLAVNDETEVLSPGASLDLKIANVKRESIDGCNALGGNMIRQLPAYPLDKEESLKPGSNVAKLNTAGMPSVEHPESNGDQKKESDSHNSELSKERLTISGQSRDMNSSTKVTGATVQALKKPSRGFGALLGPPKKKLDTEKKDKDESKLEQIRSSVNLPFQSFVVRDEQPKQVVEEHSQVVEVPQSEELPALPAARFSTEDLIMLDDDDTNEVESDQGNLETTDPPREDNSASSALEVDEEDEPMSLSDLSTSFQKCLNSSNKNKNGKAKKVEKSGEASGLLQLKPFDFEAARKHIRQKEEPVGDEGKKKNPHDSGDKKKGSAVGRAQKDDGTNELPQGKRRHAFPATGNRSATFR
ncbi:hypothetical protein Ddye_026071 [Dipteronia dyeriana]|uniref:HRDC domain-containing protein n=1 Tax=Dipteronia dyeriana TaxID=168575 RepID=A0AAD9TLK6_9ROSI|nr:hypothetical protein Ddye_026071 [Dipteronia dyeriana]